MIWLKTLNSQIKRTDPEGLYQWGLDFDEEMGHRVVCLKRMYPSDKQVILLRIEDDYTDYAGFRMRNTLNDMKERMDKLVKLTEQFYNSEEI